MASIVQVNVSQTQAPTPSTLQRTGAMVSLGATTLAKGTRSLLTRASDLASILSGAITITSMVYDQVNARMTVTTAVPHGFSSGVVATFLGIVPTAYNGSHIVTVINATTFTIAVLNVGQVTSPGMVTVQGVGELLAMVNTYFGQGNATAVYVLELGPLNVGDSVAALSSWLTAYPNTVYHFLLPREFGQYVDSSFLALLSRYNNTTAKVYFHITTDINSYPSFSNLDKCAMVMVEAPGIPATEFSAAAKFYSVLAYNPSATNRVCPLRFTFVYGVTPYPVLGNGPILAALDAANVDYISTGAEGGISDAMLANGQTMDGRDFTYWYSVDWLQINSDLDIANEVINGSNNPQAPLDYDQPGIDRLQIRAQQTLKRGITYGLVNTSTNPQVVATPFAQYVTTNPGDYKEGVYNGLAVTFVPARGFTQITFNVNVTDFITS